MSVSCPRDDEPEQGNVPRVEVEDVTPPSWVFANTRTVNARTVQDQDSPFLYEAHGGAESVGLQQTVRHHQD